MAIDIVRGKLIAALGGTAVWQFVVRAQQPVVPVIGVLGAGSAELKMR